MAEIRNPIELQGELKMTTAKAYLFHADYWQDEQWLPKSASSFEPDPDSTSPSRGAMKIAGWLANKNGWTEDGF